VRSDERVDHALISDSELFCDDVVTGGLLSFPESVLYEDKGALGLVKHDLSSLD
jgi:hypothetical protein